MKLLETKFKRGGFAFEQVWRGKHAAVYTKRLPNWAPSAGVHEVIRIKERGERQVFGTVYPPSEGFPSSEEWGVLGWTMPTLQAALERGRQLDTCQIEKQGGSTGIGV